MLTKQEYERAKSWLENVLKTWDEDKLLASPKAVNEREMFIKKTQIKVAEYEQAETG